MNNLSLNPTINSYQQICAACRQTTETIEVAASALLSLNQAVCHKPNNFLEKVKPAKKAGRPPAQFESIERQMKFLSKRINPNTPTHLWLYHRVDAEKKKINWVGPDVVESGLRNTIKSSTNPALVEQARKYYDYFFGTFI